MDAEEEGDEEEEEKREERTLQCTTRGKQRRSAERCCAAGHWVCSLIETVQRGQDGRWVPGVCECLYLSADCCDCWVAGRCSGKERSLIYRVINARHATKLDTENSNTNVQAACPERATGQHAVVVGVA